MNTEITANERPVLVIGAAGVDLVGRVDSALKTGTSSPARIRTSYGGVARNVAENLGRLGHPVILLAVVGRDLAGDGLLEHTASAGVDTQYVMRTARHGTGTYLAVLDKTGELQFAMDDMGAIDELTADYVRSHAQLFKQAGALFLDGNLPSATLRTTIQLARKRKLQVFADPTSTTLANRLIPHLPQIHVLTPNSYEAAIFCGEEFDSSDHNAALRAARHLVSEGVDLAVITLAEFGLCYATSSSSGYIPALRTEIVDPTGAGDSLTAAIIFALLHEIPPDEAVRLGISAASLTLRHPGTVDPELSLEKLYDQLVI